MPRSVPSNRFAAAALCAMRLEPGDERHVIRQAVEGTLPEWSRSGEIHPPHAVAAKEMVEVHSEAEESSGGEAADARWIDLAQRLLRSCPSHLFRQVAIHR